MNHLEGILSAMEPGTFHRPIDLAKKLGITLFEADTLIAAAITAGLVRALPPRGSNWCHWYVCPQHGVRLTTGKSIGGWQWEHICSAGHEVFRGDPSRPQTDFDGCALSGPHDRYALAARDGGILYQITGDARYARRTRDPPRLRGALSRIPAAHDHRRGEDRRRPCRPADAG